VRNLRNPSFLFLEQKGSLLPSIGKTGFLVFALIIKDKL
jgi:hypothetical protein